MDYLQNSIKTHCLKFYCTWLNFLNEIFEACTFPLEWFHSIITPIHKKGCLHDPGNYRGVSLIDSISKAFVSILNSRFSKWCDKFDVKDEAQAGFWENYSSYDNIFISQKKVEDFIAFISILQRHSILDAMINYGTVCNALV